MNPSSRSSRNAWIVTFPSFVWLIIFFLIPTVIMFLIAFKPSDPYGGVGVGWTLANFRVVRMANFFSILWRTVWMSGVTTAICLFLALPTGYYMARVSPRWRQVLLFLLIVPFWTSFLVRIFAWKSLLHPEGVIKKILIWLHLIDPQSSLLYTSGAVLMVMVYSYLPFAILPIYASAEKFDFQLHEAARDLGASSLYTFFKIFIPNIRRGIWTAVLMVLIPCLGAYVIPDLVGGPNSQMLGNKIAQRTFVDRNLPEASWLSAFLTILVLAPMIATFILQARSKEKYSVLKEGP